jgi:hypothetical protein
MPTIRIYIYKDLRPIEKKCRPRESKKKPLVFAKTNDYNNAIDVNVNLHHKENDNKPSEKKI